MPKPSIVRIITGGEPVHHGTAVFVPDSENQTFRLTALFQAHGVFTGPKISNPVNNPGLADGVANLLADLEEANGVSPEQLAAAIREAAAGSETSTEKRALLHRFLGELSNAQASPAFEDAPAELTA